MGPMEPAIWAAAALLMLLGLAGSMLPAIPGAPLILAAALLHKILLPQYLSLWTLAALASLAALSVALDLLLSVGGARWYGATSWGLLGSGVGAVIGLAGGVPGLLAGAVLGAVAGEVLFAKRALPDAARAGLGAGLGLLASAAGRALICLLMIGVFLADCLFF